jgi:serine/threonine protein kinase/tetratricopeptide (TPR) repeat protein
MRLGRYEIRRAIGAGGMGEVYLAWDTQLDRKVALKILPAAFASNRERLQRFIQEAKAASALSHPNIAHVYEIGKVRGVSFIALEYVEGQSLEVKISGRPLNLNEVFEFGIQIADALDEAHLKGITHRDIKPSNIIVSARNQAKVLDFGLAKITAPPAENDSGNHVITQLKTNPGSVMGTVQYMSPEQARGREVDHRTDIFSLGVVLYEMATGRLPFLGTTTNEIIDCILHAQPERIMHFNHEIPGELERIISKCLEKDRDRRYQTDRELLVDLKNLQRDVDITADLSPEQQKRNSVSSISSLAVLPLVNINADADTEYLADGITENIINSLSQLPRLRVMARATVFRYKGSEVDPKQIRDSLGVGALLTGRIRQMGGTFVVSTELVDTADGSQLWGGRYNSTLSDIFAVQEQIANKVVENLRLKLTGEDRKRLSKRHSENPLAYQSYLRGRYYWNKRTPESVAKAIEYFRQTIEADPCYALAYVGLADCHNLLGSYGVTPSSKAVPRAKAAAKKALDIDPDLAEAHASLGLAALNYDWNWSVAETEFKRAIELNPNYGTAHHWYSSFLRAMGQFDKAIAEAVEGVELDPLSLIANTNLALNFYYARRYEQSIEQFKQAREIDENFYVAYMIGLPYEQKGMYKEAIAEFQKATSLSGDNPGVLPAWDMRTRWKAEERRRLRFSLLWTDYQIRDTSRPMIRLSSSQPYLRKIRQSNGSRKLTSTKIRT